MLFSVRQEMKDRSSELGFDVALYLDDQEVRRTRKDTAL